MVQKTRRDLIISIWRSLGGGRIGAREVRAIQEALQDALGAGGNQSPASIARVLADAGAELKHPEIIESDAEWREPLIDSEARPFAELQRFFSRPELNLEQADLLIGELEKLRLKFVQLSDREALAQLYRFAATTRESAELFAKDRRHDSAQRAEHAEIAEWLRIWMQTPNLFADWLTLRRRSSEFRKKFTI